MKHPSPKSGWLSLLLHHLLHHQQLMWTSDSSILPTKAPSTTDSWRSRSHNLLTKRYARVLIAGIVSVSILFFLFRVEGPENSASYFPLPLPFESDLPPLYEQYHEYERRLPQHDASLPPPEGKHAKYLFFGNHAHASGWGNVMQELLLNALLTYSTKRAFVFDNYTWSREPSDYADFNGNIIPSRIPLSAIISGPIIGAPFGPESDVPRAVSLEFFREQCPEPLVLTTNAVKDRLGNAEASEILQTWIKEINAIPDRCVEFERDTQHIFDVWLFSDTLLLSIFPYIKDTPIITDFGWSPLILSAYDTNREFFEDKASRTLLGFTIPSFLSPVPPATEQTPPYPPLPGLIALHIRRGDFKEHCTNLAGWNTRYNGLNSFPELPDKFVPPYDAPDEEKVSVYLERCFPSIGQIVEKVKHEQQGRHLNRVYIMSNGERGWLKELKAALRQIGEWDSITTSRDMTYTREQKYVAQSLDMYIGQRAEVFVGNGFSSLTSNVVTLRMANNVDPQNTRFW
ncbi:hypothetical protein ARMSODRAFT_967214 [Armillaria solidipes]|uniref:Uncharacterized protein n=1 Tax=Armillaria solidipes TaxID=1076256 RepID=A0A2H3B362_9AGAR|nr:hypothetical protein ARMSODRAFT_967214 [Armillaria solidipes]